MIKKDLYYKTTDILYNVYYDNQLRFRSSKKCAVAHLIISNMGYKVPFVAWYKDNQEVNCYNWFDLLIRWENHDLKVGMLMQIGLEEFERQEKHFSATGYSIEELVMILNAFESAYRDGDAEPDYFKGLNAVLTVLMDIHQVTEEDLPGYNATGAQPDRSKGIIDTMVKRHESKAEPAHILIS